MDGAVHVALKLDNSLSTGQGIVVFGDNETVWYTHLHGRDYDVVYDAAASRAAVYDSLLGSELASLSFVLRPQHLDATVGIGSAPKRYSFATSMTRECDAATSTVTFRPTST